MTASVHWTSSASAVAEISDRPSVAGQALGLSVGSTAIGADFGPQVTASTIFTVSAPVVVSISVAPVNPSIALGLSQQFTATGTYSDHSTHDMTATVV